MANTFSQIYIQIVFAVKNKEPLIQEVFREELQHYITGIIERRPAKVYAIYCMPNHVHIFISIKPSVVISDLVKDVKTGSGSYINDRSFLKVRFAWQEGFEVFSYDQSYMERVVKYIKNQKEHQRLSSFKEEYASFLQKFDLQFEERYLFEWI